jgi:hypothetical protein
MKSLILILAFFSASAFAQDPWFFISSTDTHNYYGKKESFETTKTGGKFIIRFEAKNSNKPFFTFAEMKTSDCNKKYGTVYFFDFNGKNVLNTFQLANLSFRRCIWNCVCR